ncbi:MAG: glycosyltransferase family 4 protein [Candidatus Thermoplasmatota archaeon]|nr:glycosyltransferase family 4 protein [Candidatus Thermoplasmatota archaeon]
MKIVHFSWEFPPIIFGGLGTFTTEVTQKQAYFGHEVTVFSLNKDNNYKTYEKYNGIDVYRPKTLDLTSTFQLFADPQLRSWGPYFKFFADVISYNTISASQLVNLLVRKEGKTFDIIDAHDWLGIPGGMIVKKELQIPLMFHVHSTEIGRSVGRGSHNIKEIEFEGGQTADCVITVSYAMKDELEKFGFPPYKIRVCYNGVDPSKYDPKKITDDEKIKLRRSYGINDDENMLFFIGRLVTVKGVDNLLKALPSVLKDYPKTKLVIVGVGDMEWSLKSLAENLGIKNNVIFKTEFISENERIKHYAAADCVVIPSIYEPFGIVCTEAMSMAKPTVIGASGTSGMREQIIPSGDKQCGIHINPYNPNDIAWGIKQVLQKDDKGHLMGENARERVLENFSWDIVTKKLLNIYKEFV